MNDLSEGLKGEKFTYIVNTFRGLTDTEIDKIAHLAIKSGISLPTYGGLEARVKLYVRVGDKERAISETRSEAEKAEKAGTLEQSLHFYDMLGDLRYPVREGEGGMRWHDGNVWRSDHFLKLAKLAHQIPTENRVDRVEAYFQRAMFKPEEDENYHAIENGRYDFNWGLIRTFELGEAYLNILNRLQDIQLPNKSGEVLTQAQKVYDKGLNVCKSLLQVIRVGDYSGLRYARRALHHAETISEYTKKYGKIPDDIVNDISF